MNHRASREIGRLREQNAIHRKVFGLNSVVMLKVQYDGGWKRRVSTTVREGQKSPLPTVEIIMSPDEKTSRNYCASGRRDTRCPRMVVLASVCRYT